jgi:hypothetical protein
MSDEPCLHCDIGEAMRHYLDDRLNAGATVNVVDVISMMSEAIVDVILEQDLSQHASLVAETVRSLGYLYLEKSGAVEGESNARH